MMLKKLQNFLLVSILILSFASAVYAKNAANEIGVDGADDEKIELMEEIPYPVTGGNIYYSRSYYSGNYYITDCDETVTSADIPFETNGVKITEIGDYAFSNCKLLTSVTISEGITKIDYCAFLDCVSLTNVTIPDSVTSIESNAFEGCSALKSINIPEGVSSLNGSTFKGCTNLTDVNVASRNKYYKSENGVLFSKYGLNLYFYPLGKTAETYTIPNTVKTIEDSAFCNNKNLKSITIPINVETIEDYAFEDCINLQSVTLNKGLTKIGREAFRGCSDLETITIPSTLTTLGVAAFADCTIMHTVKFKGNKPAYDGYDNYYSYGPFDGTSEIFKIVYTQGKSGWSTPYTYFDNHFQYDTEAIDPPGIDYGDVDGDEVVSAGDAALVLQRIRYNDYKLLIEEETDDYMKYADVNGDGELTTADAVLIFLKAKNNTFKLPVEQ